jgi:hypothetical protein
VFATNEKVTIQWFVYAGDEKIRFNSSMRGSWGFDVVCSCGWESKTGGAVRRSVAEMVQQHKRNEHNYSINWNFKTKRICQLCGEDIGDITKGATVLPWGETCGTCFDLIKVAN